MLAKGEENFWASTPMGAVNEIVSSLPLLEPDDPGMFSFGAEERVSRIPDRAGFCSALFEWNDFAFPLGRGMGSDKAAAPAAGNGSVSRLLDGKPQSVIRQAFELCLQDGLVSLLAAASQVSAGASLPSYTKEVNVQGSLTKL